jgi:E3 ubiquitin-protein ligase CHFR
MMKEIEKKKFSYIFDKKIMRVPPLVSKEVPLSPDSAVCDLCWRELWFQMVFAYRNAITADLPSNVRDRPPCYWGINCRTMDHNQDHARKYNHILFQTRFS